MSENLLSAIFDFVSNSSPDHIEQVAGKIALSDNALDTRFVLLARTPSGTQRLNAILQAWHLNPLPPLEVSGLIRGTAYSLSAITTTSNIDLIWTGPSTALVPTRKTEPARV